MNIYDLLNTCYEYLDSLDLKQYISWNWNKLHIY